MDQQEDVSVKQNIKGNDNIQAGRDVYVNPPLTLDPDNPNIIECPQCRRAAGRYSKLCVTCGYEVARHFNWIEWARENEPKKKQANSLYKGGLFCLLGVPLIAALIQNLVNNLDQSPTMIISVLVGLVLFKAAGDKEKSIEPFDE